jgi:hypothetical protein
MMRLIIPEYFRVFLGAVFLIPSIYIEAKASNAPPRLSQRYQDLGLVSRVLLTPGLASVINFPGNVREAVVGNPKDVKVFLSKAEPRSVIVTLTRGASQPTNLIVRLSKSIITIDLIPSRSHQDVVEIRGAFGSAAFEDSSLDLAASSGVSPTEDKAPSSQGVTLIDSSDERGRR